MHFFEITYPVYLSKQTENNSLHLYKQMYCCQLSTVVMSGNSGLTFSECFSNHSLTLFKAMSAASVLGKCLMPVAIQQNA